MLLIKRNVHTHTHTYIHGRHSNLGRACVRVYKCLNYLSERQMRKKCVWCVNVCGVWCVVCALMCVLYTYMYACECRSNIIIFMPKAHIETKTGASERERWTFISKIYTADGKKTNTINSIQFNPIPSNPFEIHIQWIYCVIPIIIIEIVFFFQIVCITDSVRSNVTGKKSLYAWYY